MLKSFLLLLGWSVLSIAIYLLFVNYHGHDPHDVAATLGVISGVFGFIGVCLFAGERELPGKSYVPLEVMLLILVFGLGTNPHLPFGAVLFVFAAASFSVNRIMQPLSDASLYTRPLFAPGAYFFMLLGSSYPLRALPERYGEDFTSPALVMISWFAIAAVCGWRQQQANVLRRYRGRRLPGLR